MRDRDYWDREERYRRAGRDDYGQADYSRDYAYDPSRRSGYRVEADVDRHDFGQGDYSEDYAYDPQTRRGYRVEDGDRPRPPAERPAHEYWENGEPRSWNGAGFGGHGPEWDEARRRRSRHARRTMRPGCSIPAAPPAGRRAPACHTKIWRRCRLPISPRSTRPHPATASCMPRR